MRTEIEMLALIRLRNAQRELDHELETAPGALVRRLATALDALLHGDEAARAAAVECAEKELARLRAAGMLPSSTADGTWPSNDVSDAA